VNRLFILASFACAALSLGACGGGSTTPAAPAPTPTPTAAATPPMATGSGKVVDYSSQTPLAGIQISLGAWAAGAATPAPVATTAADGTFSFQAKTGDYLLRIGSDSSSDTRTTLEQHITLVAGANPLAVAIPTPAPQVTPDPVQLSGNFRLHTLTSDDSACLSAANQAFATVKLGPYADDEYVWELDRWLTAEDVANPGNQYVGDPMRQNQNAGIGSMLNTLFNVSVTNASYGGALNTYAGASDASVAGQGIASSSTTADDGGTIVPFRFGITCDPSRGYAEGHGLADFR
jgi:hypothetical protein